MSKTTQEDIKVLMDAHGLKAKRVAALTESSVSSVYMWLRGERNIPKVKWDLLQRKVVGTRKVIVLGVF